MFSDYWTSIMKCLEPDMTEIPKEHNQDSSWMYPEMFPYIEVDIVCMEDQENVL